MEKKLKLFEFENANNNDSFLLEKYGLDKKKAEEFTKNLSDILKERDELKIQYNQIIRMDIELPETAKLARELRLKVQKNRTKGIEIWHKRTKEFYLRACQFIDAKKNLEVEINKKIEEDLYEIEKYEENKRLKEIEQLRQKRYEEIKIYLDFIPLNIDLGILTEDEYIKLYTGAKLQYEKAEKERIERERLEKLALEREKLKTERMLEIAPYTLFVEKNFIENIVDLTDEEFKKCLDNAKKEKIKYDEENERLRKEKEAAEEKLRKQREEIERIEREKKEIEAKIREEELRKKLEEEEFRKKEELEKQRIQMLSDDEKLYEWVSKFALPNPPVNSEKTKLIIEKFESFKKWSVNLIKTL